jgi:transposase
LRFGLTGGQVHESRTAEAMLEGVECDAVIADKAYDSNAIRGTLKAAGMKAVIPSSRSRKRIIRHDKALYRERNRIERCLQTQALSTPRYPLRPPSLPLSRVPLPGWLHAMDALNVDSA